MLCDIEQIAHVVWDTCVAWEKDARVSLTDHLLSCLKRADAPDSLFDLIYTFIVVKGRASAMAWAGSIDPGLYGDHIISV